MLIYQYCDSTQYSSGAHISEGILNVVKLLNTVVELDMHDSTQ